MRLDEVISKIDPKTVIAVRRDGNLLVHVGMCEELIRYYRDAENCIVQEIEPNGYTDSDGISHLLIRWYDKNELPFPLEEIEE